MSETAWFQSFFGEDYLEIYRDAFPVERTAAEVDGIASLLGLGEGARVLDLACGHGRHSIALAERGFDVTGYDLSEVFLERAREDAEAERTWHDRAEQRDELEPDQPPEARPPDHKIAVALHLRSALVKQLLLNDRDRRIGFARHGSLRRAGFVLGRRRLANLADRVDRLTL